jgi:hypothetical protein
VNIGTAQSPIPYPNMGVSAAGFETLSIWLRRKLSFDVCDDFRSAEQVRVALRAWPPAATNWSVSVADVN